jgi:opacity protein-like surface antigen
LRKTVILVLLVLSLSLCSIALDVPRAEVFGGYSFFRADLGGLTSSQNTNGWDAALTIPFHRYLGITADMGGQYKSFSGSAGGVSGSVSLHEYNFLFGPTVTARSKSKLTPFAHVLFGVSHLSGSANVSGFGSGSNSWNSFAMAFGGGLDVKVNRAVSIRLGQFDWLRTSHNPLNVSGSPTQNNFRYSAGIVLGL